jgi:hypothetical protein
VLAELAALALGESKLDAAVDLLRRRWDAEPLRSDRDRTLLRAAALARTPRALDWLTTLAADADAGTARRVIEELGVHRGHRRVAQALHGRLAQRGDAALLAVFETHFGGGRDGAGGTRT